MIDVYRPLADRMRPETLDHFIGQGHILGRDRLLTKAINQGGIHSMVFWGPPGTGKTTLAKIIAKSVNAQFIPVSAVLSGVKEIRAAIEQARASREINELTILFVDEAHRFNKAQQDAFLPYVEDGTIFFIGATTENPSFELNNALLSRVKTYVLKKLTPEHILSILQNAITNDEVLSALDIKIEADLLNQIADASDGDGRRALNFLEIATEVAQSEDPTNKVVEISASTIEDVIAHIPRRFDKSGDLFYEQISALHKSVRGSNPDAALYWFSRMIDGGCDPKYIARRVLRMASEDIGNADPKALDVALSSWQTYERLGSPEGELAIAQAITYLASTAKSNAVYVAHKKAMHDAKDSGSLDVPMHLRNASTKFMKDIGYGSGYRYAHDEEGGVAIGETYFPDEMGEKIYYEPVERGLEIKIKEKLDRIRESNASSTEGRSKGQD